MTPSETRVALVENGMLQEVYLERESHSGYVGNIYKGKVNRVLPGMQAAFVDIGLQRAAFLHANDMYDKRPPQTDGQQRSAPEISDKLCEGQEVIVQVVKDPLGSKGARLTTNISIPSRYLVLLPNTSHVGVSVRIEDEEERERLRSIVEDHRPEGSRLGYIVRTNAEKVNPEALASDIKFLSKLWDCIREQMLRTNPADCVYEDLRLSRRALRDLMSERVERVRIDSKETYTKVVSFAQQFMPEWVERITHYSGDRPIFDLYGIEDEMQRALMPEVPLKSGGYLIVEQTEAMTTIDVNTGGYVGHANLEDTIYRTNLEAAQAIPRQLRLRNLGGIIILDFIDMEDEEHQTQVLKTLERMLEKDYSKTNVSNISSLGLVEMTRKRTRESLERMLCEPCPCCSGRGTMKTAETVCYEIFREILRAVRQFEAEKLMVLASPNVVDRILDIESETVADLERFIDKTIRFQMEDQYNQEQFDVVLL